MNKPEEELKLTLKSRPAENISLSIPLDTIEHLNKIASCRDMSIEALLKFYIGQGLRSDISKQFTQK